MAEPLRLVVHFYLAKKGHSVKVTGRVMSSLDGLVDFETRLKVYYYPIGELGRSWPCPGFPLTLFIGSLGMHTCLFCSSEFL